MENYRYLLSLPSELSKLKNELLEQQVDLNELLENANSFNMTRKTDFPEFSMHIPFLKIIAGKHSVFS